MSNRFWTDKTDGVDNIVAEDFNSAFNSIASDMDKKANKQTVNGGFEGGNGASAGGGSALGTNAKAIHGGAVGYNANTTFGGSVGLGAYSEYGGSVGASAKTSDGFAGGKSAQAVDSDGNAIDAIQLGMGTNSEEKTAQFYDYKIMKSDGNIPVERLTELKKLSVPHTTASGYPVSVSDHLEGERVIDYKVYGNSVQDGTPTPDTPIEIRSVGDLVTDTSSPYYGKYDVPVAVCGKNLIDETQIKSVLVNSDGTKRNGWELSGLDGTFTLSVGSNWNYTIPLAYKVVSVDGVFGNYTALSGKDRENTVNMNKGEKLVIYLYSGETVPNDTILLEYGTSATSYEPYIGETKHIYLDEPLRKVGDYADYVDYENQRVVRQIEVLDSTGTKTIDESFGLLATPTTEPITAPELVVPQSGTMNISATTSIKPSKLDLTYYQDINKVITELKNAILAQGGNV